MAISATLLTSAINSQLMLSNFKGRDVLKLSGAIGNALSIYLRTPNLVSCLISGSAGVTGTIISTGVIGLSSSVLSNFMYSRALLFNYKGRDLRKFFDAISRGINTVLIGMMLTGTVLGVGAGGGIGNFSSVNEIALSQLLYSNMMLKNFLGRDCRSICEIIAFGIANYLRSSVKFSVVVTGVVSPVPPVPVVCIPSVFTQIN